MVRILKFIFTPGVLLLIVIPIVTVGFNIIEGTNFYEQMIGIEGVSSALDQKLLGIDFDSQVSHWLYRFSSDCNYNFASILF
jgi:hypothetical protein